MSEINVGDRLVYTDAERPQDSFSGTVTNVCFNDDGDAGAYVVEGDDGRWYTLDVGMIFVASAKETLN